MAEMDQLDLSLVKHEEEIFESMLAEADLLAIDDSPDSHCSRLTSYASCLEMGDFLSSSPVASFFIDLVETESPLPASTNPRKRHLSQSNEGLFFASKRRTEKSSLPVPSMIEQQQQQQQHPTEDEQKKTEHLLQENFNMINLIRENLVGGKLGDNFALMASFRNNVHSMLNMSTGISDTEEQMPPLPVKLNTSFCPLPSVIPSR